jgi:integrase
LKYLQLRRPKCSCRNLFVTLHPPYRPVTAGSLLTLLRRKIKSLAIEAPQTGPRGFRHACATQLLHKGYSLSEIADFLGHRSTTSVSVYAKPSASSVRKVCAFSLGALA